MIHIVFNEPDVKVLQEAQELDASLQGQILLIRDDYAVGPIRDIFTEEGAAARKAWWAEVLAGGDYAGLVEQGLVNDEAVVSELRALLEADPEAIAWIWAGQNKHDVSGYYWLMSQLKELVGRIFILYMNNLPFINEKGHIFYPEWLSQIPPREFLKAKKLARPITLSEFEVDPDEWTRVCNEDKGVRLLEGGKKLTQAGYDHYDTDLLKYVTTEWQKGSKVINSFLSKNKQTTGDAYLLWRLKQLVQSSGLDLQGELRGMKDFEVKIPSPVGAGTEGH
jgi:Protein of unknown function/Domain of unknown function (DUF1835)